MPHTRDPGSIRSTADFARYVGLARTTVSRVLNGHPGVKRSTVERVHRALEQTGFTPNAFAIGLRGKGAAVAGICMENLLTPPMVAKLALLQKRLRERGFTCLIEVLAPGRVARWSSTSRRCRPAPWCLLVTSYPASSRSAWPS